ncbi:MAG: Double zinc ribbon [Parcubacteria group bacterium ADurb.Bin159]|jgi:hypothetical protein|nr:MAG: Double zinc ribbon [Parcubacteria group bacterium ADurb.Bin159]
MLQPFTDNFSDDSTEAGFQFTFNCAVCGEGYQTEFIPSKSYKKKGFFKTVGGIIGAASQVAGKYNVGYGIERGTDAISERFGQMSPEWRKEHDAAFEGSQTEARAHFHRCPKCTNWVCENCWNEQINLCVSCGPREAVEIAVARAQKIAEDIAAKTSMTQVFTGEIENKQTLCPACGKPSGSGKFCVNCGASLELVVCSKCGAKNPVGIKFCGNCGEKLS